MRRSLVVFALLLSVVGSLLGLSPGPAGAATSGRVVFHVYTATGTRVPWSTFRKMENNGKGGVGLNDMLVDPSDLTVVAGWPLFSTGGTTGDPAFTWPGRPVSLALAWPTSDGYSNLIVDVPGPGTYNFTVLAGSQAVTALDAALAARPGYVPGADVAQAVATAHTQTALASATSTSEAAQGAAGAQALDAAVHATTGALAEYGIGYARTNRALGFRPPWGVTFDSVAGGAADLATVSKLVGGDTTDGWVRVVFDASQPASAYAAEVAAAHAAGLHVVGQILDSSDMATTPLAAFQSRVASYVTALATVDEWEVGNEVNGNWLGTDVMAKVSYAAAYVRSHTTARTMLTLYWQLGEDDPAHSMFTWARANLTSSVLANIDDLGLSVYPEQNPLGVSLDRAVTTLHRLFPAQRVAVTELGYGIPGVAHTWWWGSATDTPGAGRLAVARYYQSAMLGYPWSGGGTYWWCYLTDALPTATKPLWSALASLHAQVTSVP